MGVDIAVYRSRIGLFYLSAISHGPKSNKHKVKSSRYSPYTGGSDIHFCVLLCMIVIGMELIACEVVMVSWNSYQNMAASHIDCSGYQYSTDNLVSNSVSVPFNYTVLNQYRSFFERQLLLSSDVELNPGPLTDKEEILGAIQSSKDDVLMGLRTVEKDILSIRSDIRKMQSSQAQIETDLSNVKEKQTGFEKRMKGFETDMKSVIGENEVLRLDIDELYDRLEEKDTLIDKLDQDVDRLERYSRRDTIRVFGLKERINESYDTIKQYVIDSVLKLACPDVEWSDEDIVRTHRVGYKSEAQVDDGNSDDDGQKPQTLLIKFLHWDKKMKVLKGHEVLREAGIRIGDDLTRRQRKTLQDLSARGKYGYYYRGELIIKDVKPAGSSRVFRRAQRKLNDGQNMEGVESGNDEGGHSAAEALAGVDTFERFVNNK